MKKYSRVFDYLKQYKSKLVLYVICTLLSILFAIFSIGLLMPFLQLIFLKDGAAISKASDEGLVKGLNNFVQQQLQTYGEIGTLSIICLFMMASILLKNLFLYLSYYILNPLKNEVVNNLRIDMFGKVLQLPIGYFTEKRKGDLMSRIGNDVAEVESSVVGTLEGFFRDPLTILCNLIALCIISVQLTIFILLAIPVMGFVIGNINKSLKKSAEDLARRNGIIFSILEETLSGLRIIKAYSVEDAVLGKFKNENDELLKYRNKISYRRDLASPLSEVMGVAVFCGILYFGGTLILGHKTSLTPEAFLGYLGLFYGVINPAKGLSTSFSNMAKGSAAIGRIEDVMQAPNVVTDSPNATAITAFTNSIELKNVSFAYNNIPILTNINLTIHKGKTVALVGSSGAGKSTLADLIPRFHDVTSGQILIDGIDIKDVTLLSLRKQISIVTQEPILFNDSIANNIALGTPSASLQNIEQAATVANAHAFIQNKKENYNYNIGDRGNKLSGGEKQRITIARALLKNPPILILDEATSSLDTESEKLVQDAINNMMQNRTSIVIAHRLSTIKNAHEIVVLQKGEIVERGTHDSLMLQQGYYHKLVTMQQVK